VSNSYELETDVLVVGGGMAGLFAAIKAADQGARVTLVDKGYAGRSGSTPHAFFFAVFNPAWGHDLDAWMKPVNTIGEYVNNREWTEIVFKDSHDRYQDLLSWGVEFIRDEKGEVRVARFPGIETQSPLLKHRVFGGVIRKQAVKQGVKIIDRVMVTDLLKDDGRVVGAVGMAVDSFDSYVFRAKATVMCSGGSGFRPPGWPVSGLTGDGDMMAYRAGAVISGKEFNEIKSTNADYPAMTMSMGIWFGQAGKEGIPPNTSLGGPPQVNALKGIDVEGNEIRGLAGSNFIELELEAHAGRAPLYAANSPERTNVRVGGAAAGLSVHTCEGIWPVDAQCATNLPGLYAAGDSCCSMQVGATYGGVGYALAGASVTGARAGLAASEYARQAADPGVDKARLATLRAGILAPAERAGGFSPRWVTQVLQNTMVPYFTLYVKKGDRLQAALTTVEFLRDHLVPKLYARDPHELRLAHETKNMVHNAEAKLRASLFRTESRGTHYREDYPHRDDPDWLAWVMLKDEGGEMKASKKPVPREWWPDLSRPYEERYPNRYPGE
jgi:succinate dehydrogenase/fumarate reductase flavoprotein subunit